MRFTEKDIERMSAKEILEIDIRDQAEEALIDEELKRRKHLLPIDEMLQERNYSRIKLQENAWEIQILRKMLGKKYMDKALEEIEKHRWKDGK